MNDHEYETGNKQTTEAIAVNRSPSLGKLAEALAKAQGEIVGAIKDSENPYFKSKYADLASVWEACRLPLSKNGLAVMQTTTWKLVGETQTLILETMLIHSSGEWRMSELPIKPVKDDPQGMGSAITYGRRQSLAAIVGVSPEDDDANAASGLGVPSTAKSAPRIPNGKRTTPPIPPPTFPPIPPFYTGPTFYTRPTQPAEQTPAPEISPPADGDKAGAVPPGQSVPTGAAEPAAPVESPKAMDREEFRALAAKLASHGLAGTQAKAITLINDYIARCDGKPSIGSVVKENAQKIARLLAHQLEKDGPGITVASIKAVLGT